MSKRDHQYENNSFAQGYDAQHQSADGRTYSYGMGRGAVNAAPQYQPSQYQPQGAAYSGQASAQQYVPQQYQQQQYTPQQYVPQQYAQPQYATAQQPQIQYVQAPKKKKSKAIWIAIIVALICIGLAAVLAFNMLGLGKSKRSGDVGQLEGKTPAEIQAELDRVVEEGMFNISIASNIQMENGASPAQLRIENVPGNPYLMRVVITRDDTGQQIYETELIEPNHHIQQDTLDVNLPAGSYDCTATFFAHDEETEEVLGQAAAKIVIDVMN